MRFGTQVYFRIEKSDYNRERQNEVEGCGFYSNEGRHYSNPGNSGG